MFTPWNAAPRSYWPDWTVPPARAPGERSRRRSRFSANASPPRRLPPWLLASGSPSGRDRRRGFLINRPLLARSGAKVDTGAVFAPGRNRGHPRKTAVGYPIVHRGGGFRPLGKGGIH